MLKELIEKFQRKPKFKNYPRTDEYEDYLMNSGRKSVGMESEDFKPIASLKKYKKK